LYAGADIFVLPSYAEGLPNSMFEAMAARLPVVVTPVGSIPDVVVNNANGLVIPLRDVPALTNALEFLSNAPDERERLGKAAQALASQRFGVERAAERLAMLVHTAARERLRRSSLRM
jgi:glycosyltransferase involved in cell wall biosynthesis